MNEAERNTIIKSLGLTYSATFIPTKQPRKKVEHPQLHWEVTLNNGRQSMTIPYRQGCGHVPGYQQFHKNKYENRLHNEMIREACETGVYVKHKHQWLTDSYIESKVKVPEPKLADVLYCLVMDSDCFQMSGFEDWASNYGYNLDSRKAEQTYRQCIDQSLKFRNLIGQQNLDALQEAFRDY